MTYRKDLPWLSLVALLVLGGSCSPPVEESGSFASGVVFDIPDWSGRWYKGNTHTHTTNSDGDSKPEYVARWYKENGYDFLVLSDHNVLTDPEALSHIADDEFLLIPGEEVTSSFESAAVHVNGLNIPHVIEPRRSETLVATI